MSDSRLGEMLLNAKLISEDQLKTALETQKQVPGDLSVILTKLRIINEDKLSDFLGQELKLPVLKLQNLVVSPQVSALIDVEILEKNLVLPIRKKDDETLLLAVANPLDYNAVDEIRFLTGLRAELAVSSRSDIQKAIDYYCHGRECKELQAVEATLKNARQGTPAAAETSGAQGVRMQVAPSEMLKVLVELLIDKNVVTREELAQRLGKGK